MIENIYLKKFETHSAYNTYITGNTKVLPNVSLCDDMNEVHYNPRRDVIVYTASAKLSETTTTNTAGLHTNAFNTTIKSHNFSNGRGVIEFNDDVTSVGNYAFRSCSLLTSVTIGSGVTSIGNYAFQNCTSLISINIPSSVTSIGNNAFDDCSSLTSVTIGSGVTSIGYNAFYGCSSLTSVTIGSGVTSIGQYAFSDCTSLTSINIPSSVTSIGNYAFINCGGLTSITVDTNNATYDSRNNCNAIIETSTNKLIRGCNNTVIPNTVTNIGTYAFNSYSSLTSITIPSSVTSIGTYAFQGCSGLISINIPNNVTTISECTFSECSSLTSITIPSSVTSIGNNAFRNCSGLESVTCLATTAPTIQSTTFRDVKTGGTLYVPTGSNYSTWMGTGNYYLGKYNWTKVEQ